MRLPTSLLFAGVGLLRAQADLDRDGFPDKLEQLLLERFAPEFVLAAAECDGLPAELVPGVLHPQVLARNGTVYGQASPVAGSRLVELHYFHLWGRDCGRAGHALDAEHISALIEADRIDAPPKKWKARYWYAAGHEGTVCDRSTGARAAPLHAVEHGPPVWVSAGTHASYFDPAYCSWGCGADRCALDGFRFRPSRIINLGERGAPVNGSVWIASNRWNLGSKLGRDFSPGQMAALDKSARVTLLWPALRPAQSVLMAGSEVGAALAESGGRTSEALRIADGETTEALAMSMEKTGRAVKRSTGSVARFLGYKRGPLR